MPQPSRNHAFLAPPETEADLVERARRGEEDAVRSIIQTHNRRLFRVARGVLHDDVEAEDALQEAYLKAFTRLDAFRGAARLSTWLTRIVVNEARARLRRRHATTSLEAAENPHMAEGASIIPFPGPSADADPESAAARAQLRELLERAVDELPEPFRLVFVMREIEGMSVEETAASLELKPETVKSRLFRARRLMRSRLEKRLVSALDGAFPFGGRRCARMADAVVARLAAQRGGAVRG